MEHISAKEYNIIDAGNRVREVTQEVPQQSLAHTQSR